jgi:hypothetical protein
LKIQPGRPIGVEPVEPASETRFIEAETSKIFFYLNATDFDAIGTDDFLQTNFV